MKNIFIIYINFKNFYKNILKKSKNYYYFIPIKIKNK